MYHSDGACRSRLADVVGAKNRKVPDSPEREMRLIDQVFMIPFAMPESMQ
jgi:hypothetical protein